MLGFLSFLPLAELLICLNRRLVIRKSFKLFVMLSEVYAKSKRVSVRSFILFAENWGKEIIIACKQAFIWNFREGKQF